MSTEHHGRALTFRLANTILFITVLASASGCGRINFALLGHDGGASRDDGGIRDADPGGIDGGAASDSGGIDASAPMSDGGGVADASVSLDGGPIVVPVDAGAADGGGPTAPDGGTIACPVSLGCRVETFATHRYCACNGTRSWDQARAACMANGLDLIRVDTPEEDTFATALFVGRRIWIGATDGAVEGVWRWIVGGDDLSTTYSNWEAGQPDNLREADCAFIETTGGWDDDRCDPLVVYRFVCEEL
jgi:hypothetical protein